MHISSFSAVNPKRMVNGLSSMLSVFFGCILVVRGPEAEHPFAGRLGIPKFLFLLASFWEPPLHTPPAPGAGIADFIVKCLAGFQHRVSVVLEKPGHRYHIGQLVLKLGVIVEDTGRIRPKPGEHRGIQLQGQMSSNNDLRFLWV